MLADRFTRSGFAFLKERLDDTFENGHEKLFGIQRQGLQTGLVNLEYPADVVAIHPVSDRIFGIGKQVFADDFFKGRRLLQQFLNPVPDGDGVIRFFLHF